MRTDQTAEGPEEEERYLNPHHKERFLAAFDNDAGFQQYWDERRRLGPVVQLGQARKPRRCGSGPKPSSSTCRDTCSRFKASRVFFLAAIDTQMDRGDILALTMAQAGVSPKEITQLMGHASTRMTKRYMHLAPGHLRQAIQAMGALSVGNPVGNRVGGAP